LERLLVISSKLNQINEVRFFLDGIFTEFRLDRTLFNRVFLGVSEALSNSIIHGNRFDVNKNVTLRVFFQTDFLVIEVVDEGKGFSFDCINDPTKPVNLMNEKGRGIFLIRQLSDEMVYSDCGRKLLIKYKFN
jgi:serine/threonine-protein kinase RsbW